MRRATGRSTHGEFGIGLNQRLTELDELHDGIILKPNKRKLLVPMSGCGGNWL